MTWNSWVSFVENAVKMLVQEAISSSGLPVSLGLPCHGSDQDYELGWSGSRTEGLPENLFAQVQVYGKKLSDCFYVEVLGYGYDLGDHSVGFSQMFWGRTVTTEDLENRRAEFLREIKSALTKCWDSLPELYQKGLKEKEQKQELLARFRREGKLIE